MLVTAPDSDDPHAAVDSSTASDRAATFEKFFMSSL